MSTVVSRTVASTPARTASLTWVKIMELLAPDRSSSARSELEKVRGIASSSIASEATKDDAFVVYGGGPRVRVYCAFGDDAVTGDGVNEEPLAQSPMGDGWRLSIPCLAEDLEWSRKQAQALSSRVSVRAVGEDVEDGSDDADEADARGQSSGAQIDMKEFFRR